MIGIMLKFLVGDSDKSLQTKYRRLICTYRLQKIANYIKSY